jgi:hypothetical protein
LSPFLKSGIIDAVFHCVGNSDLESITNNLKKHAKEQFYFNVNTLLDDFSSSNSKSYWSLINKLVKSSGDMSPISQLKKDNNDLISDVYI